MRGNFANHVELSCKIWSSTKLCLAPIGGVILEKLFLSFQGSCDGLGLINISLPTIDNGDVSKPQWNPIIE